MTLNLRSLRTQILINDGTTDLDVSEAFEQLDLTSGVWDDSGWFKPRGTLRLAAFVYTIAESFDCRSNTSRWKPGNVVAISLWYGEWVPLPWRLRILHYPSRPSPGNPSIEVEIGTDADLLNYRAPEGDPGGIVYGTPTFATELINGALAKAGAPGLSTGVSGLSLPFSPSKTDGTSWITYAGQVAYAAGSILWQHTNGGIRSANLTTQGLTSFAHYVVGRDEADYVPEVSQEQPPERVFVTGTTYRIEDVSSPTNSWAKENVNGIITQTEIVYQNWSGTSPEIIETVSVPLEFIVVGKFVGNTVFFPKRRTTNRKTYDSLNRLVEDFTEVEVPSFVYHFLPQTTQLIAAEQTIIEYDFPLVIGNPLAALEKPLSKRTTRKRGLSNKIDGASQTGWRLVTREISTERWEQKGPELVIYRRSSRTASADGELLPPRNSPSTYHNPPAAIFRPAQKQREELTFAGLARFTNLAGSGYADKLWSITLPSGMATSNAQCAARARTWGSIRQGRQFAISWAANLERGWLENFNPVRRIDFTVPEVGRPYAAATAYSTGAIVFYRGLSYRALSSTTGNLPTNATFWEPANIRTAYLIEALNISIDARSAAIGGRGLEVGRISTNAALPALPSTPGDAPTPGIPDPVPPFDVLITIDIQHQASVSPLTFAATTTSAPAAAHDVSLGQLTFAAASRVYWVAQHAASVRPLTFAAAASVRLSAQHYVSVSPLTFAAEATARPFVQHEVSVSPLTFAATVEGPILVQHDASVSSLTFAAEVAGPIVVQHEVSVGSLTFAADVIGPLFAQHDVSVGALTFAAAVSAPPWTPSAITTAIWHDCSDASTLFDASSGGSLSAVDADVKRIEDKSGNNRHASRSTSTAKRRAATFNGLDVVEHTTTSNYLEIASMTAALLNTNTTWEWFTVFRPKIIGAPSGSIWDRSAIWFDSAQYIGHHVESTVSTVYGFDGSTKTRAVSTTIDTLQIQSYRRASGNIHLSVNGTLSAGTSLGALLITTGVLRYNQSLGYELCESILVLNNDHTEEIEGYLAHKWGTTASLPGGHPYKTNPPTL